MVSLRRVFHRVFGRRARGVAAFVAEAGETNVGKGFFQGVKDAGSRLNAKRRKNTYTYDEIANDVVEVTPDGLRVIEHPRTGELCIERISKEKRRVGLISTLVDVVHYDPIDNKEVLIKHNGLNGWYKDLAEKKRAAEEEYLLVKKDIAQLREELRRRGKEDSPEMRALKAEYKEKIHVQLKAVNTMASMTQFFNKELTKLGNTKRQAEIEIRKAKHRLEKLISFKLVEDCGKRVDTSTSEPIFSSVYSMRSEEDKDRLKGKDSIFWKLSEELDFIYKNVVKLCFALTTYTDKTKAELDLMYSYLGETGNAYQEEISKDAELKDDVAQAYALFKDIYDSFKVNNDLMKQQTQAILVSLDMSKMRSFLLNDFEFHGKPIKEFLALYDSILKTENALYKDAETLLNKKRKLIKVAKHQMRKLEDGMIDIRYAKDMNGVQMLKKGLLMVRDAQETGKIGVKESLKVITMDWCKKAMPLIAVAAVIGGGLAVVAFGTSFLATGLLVSKGFTIFSSATGLVSWAVEKIPSMGTAVSQVIEAV